MHDIACWRLNSFPSQCLLEIFLAESPVPHETPDDVRHWYCADDTNQEVQKHPPTQQGGDAKIARQCLGRSRNNCYRNSKRLHPNIPYVVSTSFPHGSLVFHASTQVS